jgi:hypothetical protein
MKATIRAAAAAGPIVLALAGCTAGNAAPAPTVTVTHTVTSTHTAIKAQGTAEPAPTVTKTVTQTAAEPAPTVTQTVSAPASGQASGGGSTSGGSGEGHVIARFNGSGTQNTASFTTPDNWALSWSYWGCTSSPDNFIVTEYNADGSIDLNGVSVNELGAGRGPVATYAYGDAGTHYFSVNSGCNWSLVPVTV